MERRKKNNNFSVLYITLYLEVSFAHYVPFWEALLRRRCENPTKRQAHGAPLLYIRYVCDDTPTLKVFAIVCLYGFARMPSLVLFIIATASGCCCCYLAGKRNEATNGGVETHFMRGIGGKFVIADEKYIYIEQFSRSHFSAKAFQAKQKSLYCIFREGECDICLRVGNVIIVIVAAYVPLFIGLQ